MTTYQILEKLFEADAVLYLKILDTPGFAYWFNQLCLKAREADKK